MKFQSTSLRRTGSGVIRALAEVTADEIIPAGLGLNLIGSVPISQPVRPIAAPRTRLFRCIDGHRDGDQSCVG